MISDIVLINEQVLDTYIGNDWINVLKSMKMNRNTGNAERRKLVFQKNRWEKQTFEIAFF